MRFDSRRISAFLVEEFQKSRPFLEVTIDDGDIIRVRTHHGDIVTIYLIESPITVYEIRFMVEQNTRDGVFSLFLLWGELFVPVAGSTYKPNDWMAALLSLCGDKLYAFDPYGGDYLVYPVYFEGHTLERHIRYGAAIRPSQLRTFHIRALAAGINGLWKVADFEPQTSDPRRGSPAHHEPYRPRDALSAAFDLLGVSHAATRAIAKQAFRQRARQLHPDVNQHPDAVAQMQALNDAYQRVLAALKE
jgi:hypothetical protein